MNLWYHGLAGGSLGDDLLFDPDLDPASRREFTVSWGSCCLAVTDGLPELRTLNRDDPLLPSRTSAVGGHRQARAESVRASSAREDGNH